MIIGEYEGEPVLLPTDRLQYKDKHHDESLAKLNPLEFFRTVYRDLPKDGVVYAKDLGKVDTPLLKAMRNYCRNHRLSLTDYVQPRDLKLEAVRTAGGTEPVTLHARAKHPVARRDAKASRLRTRSSP